MTRWARGEADVERLLADGALERVSGARADGAAYVSRARRTLDSARRLVPDDPVNAFTLAYDAVRLACTGLLAHQGLRPTAGGGHLAVEQAVRAQFGEHFKPYNALRRRRHELEYPTFGTDAPDEAEVDDAITTAQALVEAAAALLPSLSAF